MTKSQQLQFVEAEADFVGGKFTKGEEDVFNFLAPAPEEEDEPLEDEEYETEVVPPDPEALNPNRY